MKRRAKLLEKSDVDEIVKFQQYLVDLNGDISPDEFAVKWHEYMNVTPLMAVTHVKLHRIGK